jgi:prophage DNA circulation protein
MYKEDAKEAAPLLVRAMNNLLAVTPSGLVTTAGFQLRTAVGDLTVKAEYLLRTDQAAPAIIKCFEAAVALGITQKQLAFVRGTVVAENPVLLGAILTKDVIIGFCITYEMQIVARMTFHSRQDVDQLRALMNTAFAAIEEVAADKMDSMMYQSFVALHAAFNLHMIETARPLPRLMKYWFASILPTLIVGYKLYDDAGRADELRAENKIVHPAFCLQQGLALSA